jgi:hypothetical protein
MRSFENPQSPINVMPMSRASDGGDKTHEDDLVVYQLVVDHFKQDTREFWTRANFFLIAHAGLFSAFVVTYPGLAMGLNVVSLSIPILGLGVAIVWLLVMRGAIFYLQRWRDQVVKLDTELDRFKCYVEIESYAVKHPFSSPSYITQFLPIVFGVVWLAIIISILLVSH